MAKVTYVDELKMLASATGFSGAQAAIGALTTVMGAGSALALKAGGEWDTATKTIVEGTGATGEKLDSLQASFQAVAQWGPGAATAIADLNTHLGLTGTELEAVSEAALKAKVDTNLFGDVASQMGLDAQGAATLLDQLVTASQNTGVGVDLMTRTVGRSSARFQSAGGDVSDLTALVVQAADEFGPSGLRGAMSEIMQEVDKGVIPAITSLEDQLGDTTGAVERTYEAGRTWRDVVGEMGRGAMAAVGPHGDLIGAVGTFATTAMGFLTAFPAAAGAVATGAKFMWGALTGPIGLAAAGIAALVTVWALWGDEITGFLKGAWNSFIGGIEAGIDWIRPLATWIGIDMPTDLGTWKFALEESTGAQEDSTAALEASVGAAGEASGALDTTTAATGGLVAGMRAAAVETEELIDPLEAATELVAALWKEEDEAARAARDAAAATAEFVDSLAGIMTPAPVAVAVEFPTAGDMQGGLDMVMGLLKPPMSVRDALGPTIGERMMEGLASTWSPMNVGGVLAAAFTGGGDYQGAVKALGAETGAWFGQALQDKLGGMASSLGGKLGGVLGGALGVALPLVGPLLGKAAGWITGKLFGLFDKPSEATKAARATVEDFAGGIDANLTPDMPDRIQMWINGGFRADHAKIVSFFEEVALAQGKGVEDGQAVWLRYQKAVEDGNQDLADSIIASQQEIWDAHQEGVDAQVAADEEAAAERLRIAEEHAAAVLAAEQELSDAKQALADLQASRAREATEADRAERQAAAEGRIADARERLTTATAGLEAAEDALLAGKQELVDAEQALSDLLASRAAEATEEERAQREAAAQERIADAEKRLADKLAELDRLEAAELESINAVHEQRRAADEAAHAGRMAAIAAERDAQLGEIEKAIQAELEDARIAEELKLALRKAGGDAEAIAAAESAAAAARARLGDRRDLAAAMEAREAEIREAHAAEIALVEEKYSAEVAAEEAHHLELSGVRDADFEAQRTAVTTSFDAKETAARIHAGVIIAEAQREIDEIAALREQEVLDARAAELAAAEARVTAARLAVDGRLQVDRDAAALNLAAVTVETDDIIAEAQREIDEIAALREQEVLDARAAELAAAEARVAAAQTVVDDLVAEEARRVDAINALRDQVDTTPIVIPVGFQVPPVPSTGGGSGGGSDPAFAGGFAGGGAGVVSRPTMFLAGEAGREAFWFSGARGQSPAPGGGLDYDRLAGAVADALTGVRVEVGAGEISRVALDNMVRLGKRRGYA